MKRAVLITAVVLAALALGGCGWLGLFGPPVVDFAGRALRVDGDGHLREDVTYQIGSETATIRADGTYEYTYEAYEGTGVDLDGNGNYGEGWVVEEGQRGTYTYDPDTLVLESTLEQFFDNTAGLWRDVTQDVIQRLYAYLAQHIFSYDVWVVDMDRDNTYVGYEEWRVDGQVVDTYEYVSIYDPDSSDWSEDYDHYMYDQLSGDQTYGYQRESGGTFDVIPEGIRFRPGNTVTLRRIESRYQYRWWDDITETWDPWTELEGESYSSITLTHMGAFIMAEGQMQYRGITGSIAE